MPALNPPPLSHRRHPHRPLACPPGQLRSQPHPLAGPCWRGMRVGLLGGSFNPAHDGHRHISLYALRALRLDQVWWLVTPQNPLKPPGETLPLDRRLAAARVVARHPRILVTDMETRLGTRYTADTLSRLIQRFPATRFVWLMGADNLAQIPRWRRWQRLFRLLPIAAFNRPAYALGALHGQAARRFARQRRRSAAAPLLATCPPPAWAFLRNPLHPASASAIRRQWQFPPRTAP